MNEGGQNIQSGSYNNELRLAFLAHDLRIVVASICAICESLSGEESFLHGICKQDPNITRDQNAIVIAGRLKNALPSLDSGYTENGSKNKALQYFCQLARYLVDEILTPHQEVMEGTCQVGPVIQQCAEAFNAKGGVKSSNLCTVNIENSEAEVGLSTNLLSIVLLNLLTNAEWAIEQKLKQPHKDAYEPRITVSCYVEEGEVVIAIADNGCGMKEDALSNLGALGFTAQVADQGHGLGLSGIKHNLEGIHGRIGWKSKEGDGTTVYLHLPVD